MEPVDLDQLIDCAEQNLHVSNLVSMHSINQAELNTAFIEYKSSENLLAAKKSKPPAAIKSNESTNKVSKK